MPSHRLNRIEEEIKKVLSDIIRNEINDPRVYKFTSIVSVEVTKDLKFAKIFVSVFEKDEIKKDTIKGLNSASSYMRRELGRILQLRYTPELSFILDNSIEYGVHISKILTDIKGSSNETSNE